MASTQDLSAVGDTAEFVQALRLLKIWAGNPSFDQLARRSGVPRSTLADVVKRRRRQLPALEVVRAFVQACGLPDTSAWDDAWRRLQASTLAPPERVVPRELPPNVVGFAGRDDVVKTLDTILHAPAPRLITICGTAGVGKTALAIHWAHRHADQFPDGQLYVNLRGYDPGQPIESGDVAGLLLRSLVPAGATIPPDEHARVSLFRSLTVDRRLLVLLDNASSPEHVRPLLSAGAECLVIVTSRDAMSGLVARDGAHRVQLNVFSPTESVHLLRTLVGERTGAEPTAAAELAQLCAHLPLGLRLVAEFVSSQPPTSLADHLADLKSADTLDQLDVGDDEHTSLRAVFSWSYQRLSPDAARAFRLLGAHPGRDYDDYALAAMLAAPLREARTLIRELRRSHLLEPASGGRYAMHDLLHAYAIDLVAVDPDRDTSVARLRDYATTRAGGIARKVRPLPLLRAVDARFDLRRNSCTRPVREVGGGRLAGRRSPECPGRCDARCLQGSATPRPRFSYRRRSPSELHRPPYGSTQPALQSGPAGTWFTRPHGRVLGALGDGPHARPARPLPGRQTLPG